MLTMSMKTTRGMCSMFMVIVIMSLSCTCFAASENSASGRKYHHDCKEIMDKMSGEPYSGIYTIKPDHLPPFDVYCDMETAGGGWTIIQRRMDGSEDFNRKWKDYVVGFGDLNGEFWLGLNKIHRLIASTEEDVKMTLLVEYQQFGGPIENATYEDFKILGPSTGYQLSFAEISAAGNHSESLTYDHNNTKFSTDDVDNNLDRGSSCARKYSGAWWYKRCLPSQFNAPYPSGTDLSASDKSKDDQLAFMFSEMKLSKSLQETFAVPMDCKDAFESGRTSSGIYLVNPDNQTPFKVYCDMETDGGGWTVFQRRQDGSEDFFRGWADYQQGFGDLNREFWLGLDKIHRLTTSSGSGQQTTLRFDLGDHEGNKRYAKYTTFQVSDSSTNYRMNVAGYSGDAGDSFSNHNGVMFTTKDRDHDTYGLNCAAQYKGAWWYTHCHYSNLNGVYSSTTYAEGVNWRHWKGYHYSLKFTEMKVCKEG